MNDRIQSQLPRPNRSSDRDEYYAANCRTPRRGTPGWVWVIIAVPLVAVGGCFGLGGVVFGLGGVVLLWFISQYVPTTTRWKFATVAAVVLFFVSIVGFVGFAATMSVHKAKWEQAGVPITHSQEISLALADWFAGYWPPFLGAWLLVCFALSYGICALLPRKEAFSEVTAGSM